MKLPAKLLILDQAETLGGAERYIIDFCNILTPTERRQVSPFILGGKHPLYRELLDSDIELETFIYSPIKGNIFVLPFLGLRFLWTTFLLAKFIRKGNFKTVLSNTPRTHITLWFAKWMWGFKANYNVILHDFTTPKWVLSSIAKTAKNIIVVSMGVREDARTKISEEHYAKIRIIENGIDIDRIPAPRISDTVQKVLVLGRIDRRKGQDYALQSARIVHDTLPSLEFSVVGMPFKEDPRTVSYYKELKNYVKKYSLKNVWFAGEVKNSYQSYLDSDIVLFTPIDPEPFGRITIEGLSVGKLVIAFNETGPREVLEQFYSYCQKQGEKDLAPIEKILVKSCDPVHLAKAIEYWHTNPEKMAAFTRHARTFIEAMYPLQDTKKRLIQLSLDS